ncbi:MAG: Co2+/Mg2+ efflux protein ApaG [Spirochaetia bacterium]|nr:Co2+/Mg2+ efflux protein ApaG [Spirochaetia bacterium]
MPSEATTHSIRVRVWSTFLEDYSAPEENRYLFSYRVRISNEGDEAVTLLNRHWIIIDSEGDRKDVKGPGVLGKQPLLGPGEFHEYFSFCNLETDFGTMEGSYEMISQSGETFDAKIDRFFLASNLSEFEANQFRRGQVVRHSLHGYRGVVVDFDMYFLKDEPWYATQAGSPAKNKPWYHILVDGSDHVSYAPQEQLEADHRGEPIQHPLFDFFFEGMGEGRYIRNNKTWNDLN